MLRQASVADLRSGAISRKDGHVVVAMRFYPRGLARELRDEYVRALSPDEVLFREFKAVERATGDHERAFTEVDYERRFRLSPEGRKELSRLAAMSRERDVYLVCQCVVGQACHRELLLRIADVELGAPIDVVHRAYPEFEKRLRGLHSRRVNGNDPE
jgi:uncharacterized protein YeaO (DUF488 family)